MILIQENGIFNVSFCLREVEEKVEQRILFEHIIFPSFSFLLQKMTILIFF